jgi:3-hydroxy-9,10-secoandrosta-1,3,5(10)-triene-9,17-dione monooxygenase reductase component
MEEFFIDYLQHLTLCWISFSRSSGRMLKYLFNALPKEFNFMSITEQDFKKIMSQFTTGVAIITTQHQGKPIGVTINTLTSVSLEPPLVLFCLGNKRIVYPAFFENPNYAIHILSSSQQDLCKAFSHPREHPWEDVSYELNSIGCPIIPNSLGVLLCHRKEIYKGGDHTIFLNEVKGIHWEKGHEEKAPLVYFKGNFS